MACNSVMYLALKCLGFWLTFAKLKFSCTLLLVQTVSACLLLANTHFTKVIMDYCGPIIMDINHNVHWPLLDVELICYSSS